MDKKILLTGGSGLLALNWAFTVLDKFLVQLALHKREIYFQGANASLVDLGSNQELNSYLELNNPDIIIHSAGLANVEICESNKDDSYHVNAELSANIARSCSQRNIKLVHISTDHLFSGDEACVKESSDIFPLNEYARTKAEAEKLVLEANPETLIIRTNFYGWGTSYRQSFSDQIINALRNNKDIYLFQDVFYTPILIETLVQTVHELLDKNATGIYHVVGDERLSKYEFGKKLANVFNFDEQYIKPGLLKNKTDLVKRPLDMSLSNKKTCTLLGKKLGNVEQHLHRLYEQEQEGLATKLYKL